MSEPAEYAHTPDGAYAMGLDGAPAPSWVRGDVTAYRSYKRGLDERGGPTPMHPPAQPARAKRAGRKSPGRSSSSGGPGYARRAFSPTAAYQRAAAPHVQRVSRAGDAGGLFLALVLYPIFLATVQHGAQGPLLWFRAKWLNQAAGASGRVAPASPSVATLPDAQQQHKSSPVVRPPGGFGRGAA